MKRLRKGAPALITGGAGFIGTNLAHRLLASGEEVLIYDNLSRAGVSRNWQWLKSTHGSRVSLVEGDVRDGEALGEAVREAGSIFHLAAQVAVTTSLEDPDTDFQINAQGTLNLLHAWRDIDPPPTLIYTSTNKVYGNLDGVALRRGPERYEPALEELRERGVGEGQPLDFCSPYGCSKGAADQYVLDHARTFALPALVFRMSCVYGPHQFGTEDQGWVAHFMIRSKAGEPLMLYGDGRQVRDLLFIDDLVEAFCLARRNLPALAGQVFNIGGGPANSVSLLEVLDMISSVEGVSPRVEFAEWRPGDQRYYVSDVRKFQRATGWMPQMDVANGIARLGAWLEEFSPRREAALAALS